MQNEYIFFLVVTQILTYFRTSTKSQGTLQPGSEEEQPLFRISVDYNGPEIMSTYRPQGDEMTETWFKEWYDKGGREYYMTDATTTEGRKFIAKFNNFEQEWTVKCSQHTNATKACQVHFDLAVLCAEKGIKGNCYIGPREGMHRCLGGCAAMLAGRVEPYTGKIHYGMLTFDDFLKVDLKPMNKKYKEKDLQDILENILTGTVKAPMLAESPTASAIYIKNTSSSVNTVLEQVRALSKALSNNKIDSVRRSPTEVIGELAKKFVLSVTGKSLMNNPDMSSVPFPALTRATKAKAQKAYNDEYKKVSSSQSRQVGEGVGGTMTSLNDVSLFGLAEITQHPVVLKYTENPFSPENEVAMKLLLTFPALPDPSLEDDDDDVSAPEMLLEPPFIPNYQSLAHDCGTVKDKEKYMNTENANALLLIPKIMYILYSGSKNLPWETMLGDSCVMRLITYTLRYQVGHAFGSAAIKTHGAISSVYNLSYTDTISEYPNEVIGATMLIVDMINTALTFVDEKPKRDQEACEINLKVMARLIGSTFSTLDTKGGNPSIDETVAVLGEIEICNIDSGGRTLAFSHKIYSTCIKFISTCLFF